LYHYDVAEWIENKEKEWGKRIEECGGEVG
jgi:hypothetical protein